ncbi:MAG TPA: hypothetical protein VFP05_03335 [Thermomicrobiales bacterium]|nr:hypothetical protein [Thermomicrobiales bacterium]
MHSIKQSARALSVLTAGLLLALGLAISPGGVSAQATTDTPHPAHIHSGSCAQLGDVVYPLTDVGAEMAAMDMSGTPAMGDMGTAMAGGQAIPVEMSTTVVQTTLADISTGDFAINVHESAENIGNYIACGDLGTAGAMGSDLVVGLGTLNDSGYSGIATLHDNGDGSTSVTIYLMHAGAMM